MQEGKLLTFIKGLTLLMDEKVSEEIIFTKGKRLLEALIKEDDWLPDELSKPHPEYYQQYLLYADQIGRASCRERV